MSEVLHALDGASAGLVARPALADLLNPKGIYDVECVGPREECRTAYLFLRDRLEEAILVEDFDLVDSLRGQMAEMEEVKWTDKAFNVVTTEGKNAILDKFLGLGTAYANIVMGLHTTVGNASSVYATPSPQVESTAYSNSTRPTPSFSAASAGSKATSAAVAFNINGTATITGCFIAVGPSGITTKGDTAASAAVLLSSGAFSGGSRSVVNGDTLNVTYSLAL